MNRRRSKQRPPNLVKPAVWLLTGSSCVCVGTYCGLLRSDTPVLSQSSLGGHVTRLVSAMHRTTGCGCKWTMEGVTRRPSSPRLSDTSTVRHHCYTGCGCRRQAAATAGLQKPHLLQSRPAAPTSTEPRAGVYLSWVLFLVFIHRCA